MFVKPEYMFDGEVIILTKIRKLTVENMLLNIKVLTVESKDS